MDTAAGRASATVRGMKTLLSIVFMICAAAAARAAVDEAALLAAPKAFASAFNNHHTDYPDGIFTDDCAIIDEFPPYLWAGKGSAREWYSVLMGRTPEEQRKRVAANERLELGAPKFARVNGDFAYLVVPSVLTYTLGGRKHRQTGEWTITEVRRGAGWVISAHSWAMKSDEALE